MNSSKAIIWQTSRFKISLEKPLVMGIVNVTPDSFFDGGRHSTILNTVKYCEKLLKDGADILDIGGESTRPGSPVISLEEELGRVIPVVKEAVRLNVPISVDTYKPEMMQAVLDLGVDIVNDIWALRQSKALEVVSQHPACGICIMHMHNDPQSMQINPMEGDPVRIVSDFLRSRLRSLESAGIRKNRIIYDYGIGFGKTVKQNFELLSRQSEILVDDIGLLAGWSRKSSLGAVTGQPVENRMVASVAAALLAVNSGARVVRVHDVKETVDGLAVWNAMKMASD